MSDTKIEWHEKTAAKRIGCALSEYQSKLASGLKWCTKCKAWHLREAFGIDLSRGCGLGAACLASKRVLVRKKSGYKAHGFMGFLAPTRNGDKKQARRRINYLVECAVLPRPDDLPCMDCGDGVWANSYRHEYDHPKGYDGANQLIVEAVCSRCHGIRERDRRDGTAA